jgi:hypothetical protein
MFCQAAAKLAASGGMLFVVAAAGAAEDVEIGQLVSQPV